MKNILRKIRYANKENKQFEIVQIETTTFCNFKCPNCPVSNIPKAISIMKTPIFYNIIKQLAELKFNGRILLQGYGEPLSDKRIVSFVRYARNKLPTAIIQLNSNGSYLTQKFLDKLGNAGLSMINITNNNKGFTSDKVEVHYRETPKDLSNIGGLVKVKHNYNKGFPECLKNNTLCIDVNGNVILCCNDYLSKYIIGNVTSAKLSKLWNDWKYRDVMRNIRRGVYDLDICRKCTK